MFIGFSTRLPSGGRIMFGTTLDKLMGGANQKEKLIEMNFQQKSATQN